MANVRFWPAGQDGRQAQPAVRPACRRGERTGALRGHLVVSGQAVPSLGRHSDEEDRTVWLRESMEPEYGNGASGTEFPWNSTPSGLNARMSAFGYKRTYSG